MKNNINDYDFDKLFDEMGSNIDKYLKTSDKFSTLMKSPFVDSMKESLREEFEKMLINSELEEKDKRKISSETMMNKLHILLESFYEFHGYDVSSVVVQQMLKKNGEYRHNPYLILSDEERSDYDFIWRVVDRANTDFSERITKEDLLRLNELYKKYKRK